MFDSWIFELNAKHLMRIEVLYNELDTCVNVNECFIRWLKAAFEAGARNGSV